MEEGKKGVVVGGLRSVEVLVGKGEESEENGDIADGEQQEEKTTVGMCFRNNTDA